jgi:hypothetical protein
MRRGLTAAPIRPAGRISGVTRSRPVQAAATAGTRPDPARPAQYYVELIASFAGAAGLFGALLFYFGWTRVAATYRYFGIEIGLLDLSFQDYLLRSIRSTYFPLLGIGVLGLGAVLLHGRIIGFARARALGVGLVVLGVVGVLVGLVANVGLVTFRSTWPIVPAILLAGTLACVYGAVLLYRSTANATAGTGSIPIAARLLAASVLLLLVFWLVSSYASNRGIRNATAIVRELAARPGVVLLSEQDLHLRGSGLTVQALSGDDAAYRYCYSGLRYLIRSGSRHFLLPEYWQRGRDPVLVIRDSDSIRFEYFSSASSTRCP